MRQPAPAFFRARPQPVRAVHGRFLSYSDGVHDDVNKTVWSMLAWDPNRDVRDVLIDYARFFFGPGVRRTRPTPSLRWKPIGRFGGAERRDPPYGRAGKRLETRAPELKGNCVAAAAVPRGVRLLRARPPVARSAWKRRPIRRSRSRRRSVDKAMTRAGRLAARGTDPEYVETSGRGSMPMATICFTDRHADERRKYHAKGSSEAPCSISSIAIEQSLVAVRNQSRAFAHCPRRRSARNSIPCVRGRIPRGQPIRRRRRFAHNPHVLRANRRCSMSRIPRALAGLRYVDAAPNGGGCRGAVRSTFPRGALRGTRRRSRVRHPRDGPRRMSIARQRRARATDALRKESAN